MDMSEEYKVWSIVNLDHNPTQHLHGQGTQGQAQGVKMDQLDDIPNTVFSVEDPRVPSFGHRVIVTSANGKG